MEWLPRSVLSPLVLHKRTPLGQGPTLHHEQSSGPGPVMAALAPQGDARFFRASAAAKHFC